jgi:hypothetical protein
MIKKQLKEKQNTIAVLIIFITKSLGILKIQFNEFPPFY